MDFTGTPIAGLLAYQLFPSFHSQIAYTIPIEGWPVTFADDLRLTRGRYSDSFDYTFEDVRGEAGYTSNRDVLTFGRRSRGNAAFNFQNGDFSVLENDVSVSTRTKIAGDFAVSARLSRDDYWYSPQQRYLPSAMERFESGIVAEHENMRFKPFLFYGAQHIEGEDIWGQTLRFGAIGPITDQLLARAGVGFYFGRETSMLGSLEFNHTAGPSTTESLRFVRDITLFQDQIFDAVTYEINQVLGPNLSARAFARYGDFNRLNNIEILSSRDARFGVNLTYTSTGRTRISWDSYYGLIWPDHGNGSYVGTDVEISYQITDTLELELIYALEKADQDIGAYSSTTRNYGMIRLRKRFR